MKGNLMSFKTNLRKKNSAHAFSKNIDISEIQCQNVVKSRFQENSRIFRNIDDSYHAINVI